MSVWYRARVGATKGRIRRIAIQAGLVRVERQSKFPEPVMHRIKEATCIALMLKAVKDKPLRAAVLIMAIGYQIAVDSEPGFRVQPSE